MGFFSRLFGRSARVELESPTTDEPVSLTGRGHYELKVVGESHYQLSLETLCGGRTFDGHNKPTLATLIHEDSNTHDEQAVRVEIDGITVGYLNRQEARSYRLALANTGHAGRVATCAALIVGGWDRGDGDRGHFGVKLDYPRRVICFAGWPG
jgi:hypothetical protein